MDIWTIIAIVVIIYFLYKFIKENSPEYKIGKLEEQIEYFYSDVIKTANKRIEEWQKRGSNKGWGVLTDKQIKAGLEKAEKDVKRIKEVESKFIHLRERNSNRPPDELVEFYRDWLNYLIAFRRIDNQSKIYEYSDSDTALDEYAKSVNELRIQMEEIERRFDKKLERKK